MQSNASHRKLQESVRWYLDEAREVERDLADRIGASTSCHEQCERREKQVRLAIESDLFEEFDVDSIDRVRELAASVRVKHRLLAKQLADAHRTADQCDEMLTLYQAAERLHDEERLQRAEAKLQQLVDEIHALQAESNAVCDLLYQEAQEQLTIFERMKR
jgi:hypothetical protein